MTGRLARVRELAAGTPAERNRYVDFLRALSIVAVVIGHWLAVAIVMVDGRIEGRHVLQVLPELQLATWIFQVMGVFFVVGGYANAASWTAAQHAGTGYGSWLASRGLRLLTPTTVFILIGAAVAAAARLAGLDAGLVRLGAWLIGISLWFLAVYLVVVAMTPVMLAAHRRGGLVVCLGLTALTAAGDVARLATSEVAWAAQNFVIVWLVAHQLGFAWRDGSLTRTRWRVGALFGIGLVGLVMATTVGPYPVSMVAYPGASLQNTSPPTLALLALIVTQTGLLMLVAGRFRGWLDRPRVWAATIAINGMIMSLFLWHMVPVVAAALLLYPTGIFPGFDVGSVEWFALRPAWLAVCGVLLAGLVAVFGRFERPPPNRPSPGSRRWSAAVAVAGAAAACLGIAQLTVTGLQGTGPLGLPITALGTYAVGVLMLAWVGHTSTVTSFGRGRLGKQSAVE